VPLAIGVASVDVRSRAFRRVPAPLVIAACVATAAYALLRMGALGGSTMPASPLAALRAVPALWLRATQLALVPIERAPVSIGTWLAPLGAAESLAYGVAAAALVAVLAYLVRRRRLVAAVGLAWWLAALLPASFVVIGAWPGLHRWLYVGIPGLVLLVYEALAPYLNRRLRAAILAAVLGVSTALTERAIPVWRDDAALFSAMI